MLPRHAAGLCFLCVGLFACIEPSHNGAAHPQQRQPLLVRGQATRVFEPAVGYPDRSTKKSLSVARAFNSATALAVWIDSRSGSPEVVGHLQSGALPTTTPFIDTVAFPMAGAEATHAAVAANVGGFQVVWSTATDEIRLTQVSMAGPATSMLVAVSPVPVVAVATASVQGSDAVSAVAWMTNVGEVEIRVTRADAGTTAYSFDGGASVGPLEAAGSLVRATLLYPTRDARPTILARSFATTGAPSDALLAPETLPIRTLSAAPALWGGGNALHLAWETQDKVWFRAPDGGLPVYHSPFRAPALASSGNVVMAVAATADRLVAGALESLGGVNVPTFPGPPLTVHESVQSGEPVRAVLHPTGQLVTWWLGQTPADPYMSLYAVSVQASAWTSRPPAVLSITAPNEDAPRVVWNGTQGFVVWRSEEGSQTSIRGQVFASNAAGFSPVGGLLSLGTVPAFGKAYLGDTALSDAGEMYVVTRESLLGNPMDSVAFWRIRPTLAAATQITRRSVFGGAPTPAIAAAPGRPLLAEVENQSIQIFDLESGVPAGAVMSDQPSELAMVNSTSATLISWVENRDAKFALLVGPAPAMPRMLRTGCNQLSLALSSDGQFFRFACLDLSGGLVVGRVLHDGGTFEEPVAPKVESPRITPEGAVVFQKGAWPYEIGAREADGGLRVLFLNGEVPDISMFGDTGWLTFKRFDRRPAMNAFGTMLVRVEAPALVLDAGAPDSGQADGGLPSDGGSAHDAGTMVDAGAPADSGVPSDAGSTDGGVALDGGASGDDGGVNPNSGLTFSTCACGSTSSTLATALLGAWALRRGHRRRVFSTGLRK